MAAPWMKFYPSDWRADPALRICSIAARGLWCELMCLMHEAEPYGHLLFNGGRIPKGKLASLVGITERECSALLLELEANGVLSRTDDGTIYSRRMVRDAEKATRDKANGKRGGNPYVKPGVNPQVNGGDKAQKPESRSQIDRIGSAGAFTEGSKVLASAFWKALGFDRPLDIPPEFAGVDWRAVEWESAGWSADMIATEAKRIGPGKPLSYHEKVFATAHAKLHAPLPKVEIREAETVQVSHGKSQAKPGVAEIARRYAEHFESQPGDSIEGSAGAFLRISRQ